MWLAVIGSFTVRSGPYIPAHQEYLFVPCDLEQHESSVVGVANIDDGLLSESQGWSYYVTQY